MGAKFKIPLTLLVGVLAAGGARADDPTGAVTIRWVRPDVQLERAIALFQGTRAANPAAALAAWRFATQDVRGLGKPLEALISLFNPEMVREFKSLDQAKVGIGIDSETGNIRWYAVAPNDDGNLAALVTALILTDGGDSAPFDGIGVDRLGPEGSALVARVPGVLTLAGSRADLPEAIRQAGADIVGHPEVDSGMLIRLDPRRLVAKGSITQRRVVEALRGLGVDVSEGLLTVKGDTLTLNLDSQLEWDPPQGKGLDPAWLEWLPTEKAQAVFAMEVEPDAESLASAFAWADRIERADPARAQVAPLRVRLNLLAATASVRPEVDLWPKLRGVSGYVRTEVEGNASGGILALHLVDEVSAGRLATQFLPKVMSRLDRGHPKEGAALGSLPSDARWLGNVSGKPVSVLRQGATVLVGWGDGLLAASLEAKAHPGRSAASILKAPTDATSPRRAFAFWPGELGPSKLADAPPIRWWGWDDKKSTHDLVLWEGLHGMIARYLDRLPLQPPADH
ncbi:hypothetical protein [Singulisphaera sp. PoT]|uniref:hypothetical protein n=1 Tax=Singulisphaera sp. PoT TaxID=3411797 RepID=UPI003BF5DC81